MNDEKLIRRALEIGCVVHTCSALPGAMCNTTPDNHGPPADMDPEKGPWYGVHHRRWLTWLREKQSYTVGGRYVPPGVLTAAEQVYGCDVCEAPVNVPCMHMRGPGLGKGEQKGTSAMYPNAPLKVEGRVFTKDGYETVQMTVTDPMVIAKLKAGGQEISMGYRDGKPYLKEPPGLRAATIAAGIDPDVETSAPAPSRTAGFDKLYGSAAIPEVPLPLEKFTTSTREAYVRMRVGHVLDELLAVPTTDPELLRGLVSKIHNLMAPPVQYVSGGVGEVVDQTPPENYEAMERMIRDQLIREGAHLRSVPMPDDTKPHTFKPALVEDGVSCEDCGLPKEAHSKRTMFSSLEWFKEQAKRALAVNPNITMLEFMDRVGEPEYETAAQRAFHLDEGELEIALRNVGCDLRCPACAETFFSGSTDFVHRCAMLAKLKCFRCGKPAVPKSQMCEEHARDEAEDVEAYVKADQAQNRELNGSSADTRKFAIERMNHLDQHPSLYGHTLEGLCGHLVTLLAISGVRGAEQNAFQQFFYRTVKEANERTPGPDNDPYGQVIAHARGMVLAIQMLREGPDSAASSPLKLMLPKAPEPKA